MKIATFNINNVNQPLAEPAGLARSGEARRRLPAGAQMRTDAVSRRRDREGRIRAVWRGQRTWNGVAILARAPSRSSPGPICRATQPTAGPLYRGGGRWHPGRLPLSPNGNPQPGPKFDYKLAWFERLTRMRPARCRRSPGRAGRRLQCRADRLDIYPTESWDKDALMQPKSRAAFQRSSSRAGSMRSATLHPTTRLHVLALHAPPLGRAMRACGSTICC